MKTASDPLSPMNDDGRELKRGLNEYRFHDGQYVCMHMQRSWAARGEVERLLVVVHGFGARKNSARGRGVLPKLASSRGERVDVRTWGAPRPSSTKNGFLGTINL